MHCEGNSKLRSHNTSYCLIEVVTEAGLTVLYCTTNLTIAGKINHITSLTYFHEGR